MAGDVSELYISLGHNASAIMCRNGVAIRGYEQERLDRVKGSSAYPREAIDRALGRNISCDRVNVSHWFDHFDIDHLDCKYLDYGHLSSLGDIVSLGEGLTHHDAHARSAISFARQQGVTGPMRVIVLDGFGNRQECFSAYDVDERLRYKMVHRTYGYRMSLGLMYQYVTAYLGMKQNQDEYKLLGYEAHVTEHISHARAFDVQGKIATYGRSHAHMMIESIYSPPIGDELIDYEALANAKTVWTDVARAWADFIGVKSDTPIQAVRSCVAFCAQTFLESAVTELIDLLPAAPPEATLVLTGGSFYNVKLNRRIQTTTGRKCFCHPLAGDQGAAMGLSSDPMTIDIASVGYRRVLQRSVGSLADAGTAASIVVVTQAMWVDVVADMLDAGRPVNVVRGAMEFGPRALCNTTTFAIPTLENVALINALNERDEAMPMAPVMGREAAMRALDNTELQAIRGCDGFMITTCRFQHQPHDAMMGVAHKDPLLDVWTARPQVTEDPDILRLLTHTPHGALINTSFNYHGEPIVYSFDDALNTHNMQTFRAKTLGLTLPVTVVVQP